MVDSSENVLDFKVMHSVKNREKLINQNMSGKERKFLEILVQKKENDNAEVDNELVLI